MIKLLYVDPVSPAYHSTCSIMVKLEVTHADLFLKLSIAQTISVLRGKIGGD